MTLRAPYTELVAWTHANDVCAARRQTARNRQLTRSRSPAITLWRGHHAESAAISHQRSGRPTLVPASHGSRAVSQNSPRPTLHLSCSLTRAPPAVASDIDAPSAERFADRGPPGSTAAESLGRARGGAAAGVLGGALSGTPGSLASEALGRGPGGTVGGSVGEVPGSMAGRSLRREPPGGTALQTGRVPSATVGFPPRAPTSNRQSPGSSPLPTTGPT
jgi:hypothetical protein